MVMALESLLSGNNQTCQFDNIGTLGAHISWIYSNRFDNKLNNPAMGVNFCFHLKEDDSWIRKLLMVSI